MNAATFVRNLALTLVTGGLAVWLAHQSTSVHLPFLALVLGSGLLGFFEPKWGWAWVLAMVGVVVAGRFLLHLPATNESTADFASYVAPFPALVGGLLGRLSRNIL